MLTTTFACLMQGYVALCLVVKDQGLDMPEWIEVVVGLIRTNARMPLRVDVFVCWLRVRVDVFTMLVVLVIGSGTRRQASKECTSLTWGACRR